MYIVWGSKLMGKCDVVPGLFHVATKFGHVYYIPLIPTGSFVVIEETGKTFRGVPIGLSAKSILLAWARGGTFVVGLIGAIGALVAAGDKKPSNEWMIWAGFGAAMWISCIVLCYAGIFTKASFERACALAKELKLTERGFEVISQVYGQAIPRGFEVVTPAAAPPPLSAQAIDDGVSSIPLEPEVAQAQPVQEKHDIGIT